jgi:GNAT superfamily N-acetyltransferase
MELNNQRAEFNSLNEDFFSFYNNLNSLQKILLTRQVTLLKYNNQYVGYIWIDKERKNQYFINSFYIIDESYMLSGGLCITKTLKRNSILFYDCEKNKNNFSLLEKLGFIKENGTMELKRKIHYKNTVLFDRAITLEPFIKGKHESIRCDLQNSIFMNTSREPLTLEDIYFDEQQEYFIDEGALLLKFENEYIGYGQIIMDSNLPTIVNFGIIEKYRYMGLGKLLLKSLINKIYDMNFNEVKIRVDSNNKIAYKLYTSEGFGLIREYYRWQLMI